MKQALTETLAYFDENDQAFRMSDLRIYVAAARLVERLLPGVCEECEGSGSVLRRGEPFSGSIAPGPCATCHGSGRVWDEGIVEAVAEAIVVEYRKGRGDSRVNEMARAFLSALVELLTEKVPDALG